MSPDNEFSTAITKRIAKKLDEAQAQARRVSARLVLRAEGLATDRHEWRPGQGAPPLAHEGEPAAPIDATLARLGFRRDQRVRRADASARLKEHFGEDNVELRMSGLQRLHELGLLDDERPTGAHGTWVDPRSQMPGGVPPTGSDRLGEGRGEPIGRRSRP